MDHPKKIGFLSFGAWHPGGGSTHTAGDALRQTVELAVAAEQIGIDGAFVRVHHFARQLSSPFPLLTAIGVSTSRIEIGTGVIDMRYENPLYMAEEAAAADLLAGGRLQLGVSRGSPEPAWHGAEAFGYSLDGEQAREKTAQFRSAIAGAGVVRAILGSVASLTQVLSIVFRTAAYPNPIDKTSWTPGQVAFYSSLFMVWLTFLVIWKPVLGQLNDKIGLVGMMLLSMTLMALALVYLPSMVYGSSVALMYVAMVFLSAGISNALVTPPLVITQAMGLREFGKIFALAVAFIYVGNAIGAPIWGVLGTSGNTKIGMYVAPVLLALFVIGCTIAVRRAKAQYAKLAETGPPQPNQPFSGQPVAGRPSGLTATSSLGRP